MVTDVDFLGHSEHCVMYISGKSQCGDFNIINNILIISYIIILY